ncbi:hypothetical protein [Membranihabitans maritimus]|uniref:hypothetical protein n=1 Tax=Membranihabitans maritimus TaxID=2904244 RepID=UPI001F22CBA2|nr:hypothetical protein [Membranihabitans maritimus]
MTELKIGLENEIEIVIGIPKKYRTLTTISETFWIDWLGSVEGITPDEKANTGMVLFTSDQV